MSDLDRDSFDEFLKDSLENYSSSDAPNWTEMESRLDGLDAGSSGSSGLLSGVVAKWMAAVVVVGGVTFLVATFFNNDDAQTEDQGNTTEKSFIDKIRALTIDDENIDAEEAGVSASNDVKSDGTPENSGQSGNGTGPSSVADNNDEAKTEDGDVLFTKPVAPTYYPPSGPTYSMLRNEYKNKPTPAPEAGFEDDLKEGSGCVPLKVSFKLESQDVAMQYLWDFGDGIYSTDANPAHVYRETGSYNVELTVTSLINEKITTMAADEPVVVYGKPEVDFNWDKDESEIGNEVSFIDLSSNIIEWFWDFGDDDRTTSDMENPTHTYGDEGTYTVVLVGLDPNGCADTISSTIRISGNKLTNKMFVPNSFTPNGDGSNDVFKAKINGPQNLEFEMSIYDRRSNLVFETDDMNQGWDGRLKGSGRIAPQGTYIWLITIKDAKGNHDRQLGEITLLR